VGFVAGIDAVAKKNALFRKCKDHLVSYVYGMAMKFLESF